DHAATFARYLIETRLGLLTSSAAPSVSSVYEARPDLSGVLVLAISQSGASPDLLAFVSAARAAGAYIVALVNAQASPLAQLADDLIPLCAGVERSVAATKSYIASLAAIVHLVANWTRDVQLAAALQQAPELLERAWRLDWSAAVTHLAPANNLYVVGRGLGLAAAPQVRPSCPPKPRIRRSNRCCSHRASTAWRMRCRSRVGPTRTGRRIFTR